MLITYKFGDPYTEPSDWHEKWEGPDQGLIASWHRGQEKALETPSLAASAKAGELPVLSWKGGVEKAIKSTGKLGALHYLAQWQGLRGEDLHIDTEAEVQLTCTRTNVTVTYTPDIQKLGQSV